jgi:hypothetical protein
MYARWVGTVLLAALLCTLTACERSTPAPTVSKEEKAPELEGPPFFKDVTADSGVNWTYRNGEEAKNLAILESLGGGVALIDYDGDGLLDLFVAGGGGYDGKTIIGRSCKFYRNLGKNKFVDVTKEVGLDGPWFYTHGAAVCDYDRDGWPDLLVTGWGELRLYHNEPVDPRDPLKGRHFVDVTAKAGLPKGLWTTSAAWADLDGDGYPDLYVCQYVDWSFANHPSCTYDGKTPDVCPPKNFSGLPHKLFHNNGKGVFTEVSKEAGLWPNYPNATPGKDASKGLGVIIVDVNGDGKPDVYVANDTVDNFLYINRSTPGHLKFEEVGLLSGTARDDRGMPNGSMGLDAASYDGGELPSIWVTNYENELHALYHNDCKKGNIFFTYGTPAAGIAALGQNYVGWGTGFLDLDHHGWEDLFIANGHAIHYPTNPKTTRKQKPVLMRNVGNGKFKDITSRGGPYFESQHLSRGVALGDLDNDGRVDLVISHLNDPVTILHNEAVTDGNHWLGVELVGKDYADVVGARVILDQDGRKQYRFPKGGGSYASSGDRRHVFGLGKADKVGRVTVIWPDGKEQHWDGLSSDRYYRLLQGKAEAETPNKPR